MLALANTEK